MKAAKGDHLPKFDDAKDDDAKDDDAKDDDATDNATDTILIPCKAWWDLKNLNKCVQFFFESKRGAGVMGGLYRAEVYRLPHAKKDHQSQELFCALQALFEPLQQAVLKFKDRKDILEAHHLETMWETATKNPEADPSEAMRLYISKKKKNKAEGLQQAKEVIEEILEKKPGAWKTYIEAKKDQLAHQNTPFHDLFARGLPLKNGQTVELNPKDPRYALLRKFIKLEEDRP